MLLYGGSVFTEYLYGAYGVMVSTKVCGTFSSGSNPDRHPIVEEEMQKLHFVPLL